MDKKTIQFCFALVVSGMSVASNAATYEHACKPVEVLAAGNRVHVKCAHPEANYSTCRGDGQPVIVYFAVPLTSPLSPHVTSIASTALATGKWLKISYRSDIDRSFGCREHDCRPLVDILLVPSVLTPKPFERCPAEPPEPIE